MIGLFGKKRRTPGSGGAVTLIGEGCLVEGTMHSQAFLRIEGEFNGSLHSSGEVVIGEKGAARCKELHARDVIVAGRLEGAVYAEGVLRITASGQLHGTVRAASLIIEQGAVFQGRSDMVPAPVEDAKALIAVL